MLRKYSVIHYKSLPLSLKSNLSTLLFLKNGVSTILRSKLQGHKLVISIRSHVLSSQGQKNIHNIILLAFRHVRPSNPIVSQWEPYDSLYRREMREEFKKLVPSIKKTTSGLISCTKVFVAWEINTGQQ